MRIEVQLDEERAKKLALIQERTQQEFTDLVNQAIDTQYQQLQPVNHAPLAKLKQSKSIGFIKDGDSTASTNYKEIIRNYVVHKHRQE